MPFLFLVLLTFRAAAADTLLILGDSLSAGYRMSASAAWPALLNDKWQSKTSVVNASISGDTSQQGLARLPALLKQHQPRWVLVELGGNDGLRGFQPQQTEQTLRQILQDDGIHPNRDAQPFIADWMAKQLQPLVNHDS